MVASALKAVPQGVRFGVAGLLDARVVENMSATPNGRYYASREDRDMSDQVPQRGVVIPARYRVTFAKELLGLRFPIASMDVRHARGAERALRAAELRFSRHYGIHWRTRADVHEVVRV